MAVSLVLDRLDEAVSRKDVASQKLDRMCYEYLVWMMIVQVFIAGGRKKIALQPDGWFPAALFGLFPAMVRP
jgi:hypothetical protein